MSTHIGYVTQCDGCGIAWTKRVATTPRAAVLLAVNAGWQHSEGYDEDWCPVCIDDNDVTPADLPVPTTGEEERRDG